MILCLYPSPLCQNGRARGPATWPTLGALLNPWLEPLYCCEQCLFSTFWLTCILPKDLPIDVFQIETVVFFRPDKRPMPMTVAQALGRGYGITNSPTRLVLRGPLTAPEAYSQHVSRALFLSFKWFFFY